MLRRKPGSLRPADEVDQELVEGVEAEFPWHVLIRSASCTPDEADQRLRRLLRTGFLEGEPGDLRTSKTNLPPVQVPPPSPSMAPTRSSMAPTPASMAPTRSSMAPMPSAPPSGMPSKRPSPQGEALLRELRALRGGTSVPPPDATRAPITTPPVSSSQPPIRCDVDSPLGVLIAEYSRGEGMQRWTALRLREALEEELAGNYLQAISILQVVLAQLEDPRIRTERARLQEKSQRVSSGVYRSRAVDAERGRKHPEAAEHWRRVLEAAPTDVEAALHTAKNYMEAGDLKQAAHFARRAVQLAPNNINAHRLLLHFFQRTGMEASAQREREILEKLRRA